VSVKTHSDVNVVVKKTYVNSWPARSTSSDPSMPPRLFLENHEDVKWK
jgi:hypothetical protein